MEIELITEVETITNGNVWRCDKIPLKKNEKYCIEFPKYHYKDVVGTYSYEEVDDRSILVKSVKEIIATQFIIPSENRDVNIEYDDRRGCFGLDSHGVCEIIRMVLGVLGVSVEQCNEDKTIISILHYKVKSKKFRVHAMKKEYTGDETYPTPILSSMASKDEDCCGEYNRGMVCGIIITLFISISIIMIIIMEMKR